MSFSGSRARLVDAVFARLGEVALWNGAGDPVRVRTSERDEFETFGNSDQVITVRFLLARAHDVSEPEPGDTVVMLDDDGTPDGRNFRLIASPRLTRNRVWRCEVEPV